MQGGAIENHQAEGRTEGGELLEGFGGGIANSGSSASASPRPCRVPMDRSEHQPPRHPKEVHRRRRICPGRAPAEHGLRFNQIEGGIVQSTSWTLKESVGFDRTRVTTRSWAEYPILRFDEVPEVDVVLLDQPDQRFLGVGEGSQGPTAAAIANPGRRPASRSAGRTQLRNVSEVQPIFSAIEVITAHWDSCWS